MCNLTRVMWSGHETKALLNNNGPRYKRSKLECRLNRDVIWCVLILLLMCLYCSLGEYPCVLCYPRWVPLCLMLPSVSTLVAYVTLGEYPCGICYPRWVPLCLMLPSVSTLVSYVTLSEYPCVLCYPRWVPLCLMLPSVSTLVSYVTLGEYPYVFYYL